MRKAMVINNYTEEDDSDLSSKSESVIKHCKGNNDFEFVDNELANLMAALKVFRKKNSAALTGDKVQKTLKRQAKKVLAIALKIICREINHQHRSDADILIGSGDTMVKNSNKDEPLVVAENLEAKTGITADELKFKVKMIKGLKNDGTMFAYTEALNAPDNIADWNKKFSTCHRTTIKVLKRATKYLISAAYQGTTITPLVWCNPITIWTKAG